MDGPFVDTDRVGSSRNHNDVNQGGTHSSRSITKKPVQNPNGRNPREVGSLISEDQQRDSKIHATAGNEKDNEFERDTIGPRESIGNADSKLE